MLLRFADSGAFVARVNYSYQKKQREQAARKKREEKQLRRQQKKKEDAPAPGTPDPVA